MLFVKNSFNKSLSPFFPFLIPQPWMSTLMLKFLNFIKLFEVHTNASDFVIGGVLMQDKHPITFENKFFCRAQL
jgi:hypothetical protein